MVPYPGARPGAGCAANASAMHLEASTDALAVDLAPKTTPAESFVPAQALEPGVVIQGQHPVPAEMALATLLAQWTASGCLPARGAPDPLSRVLQGLPLPSHKLANLAGGDPTGAGTIPLRFGELLRVTAPLLDTEGNVKGATTLWYGLRRQRDGRLEIRPPAANAITVVRSGEQLHAQALELPRAPVARYWQMIVFGRNGELKQVNVLVGVDMPAALEAATARIQARGTDWCAGEVAAAVRCAAPRYGTVINVELSVQVQGRWLALRRGTTVGGAIGAAEPDGASGGVPQRLRVLHCRCCRRRRRACGPRRLPPQRPPAAATEKDQSPATTLRCVPRAAPGGLAAGFAAVHAVSLPAGEGCDPAVCPAACYTPISRLWECHGITAARDA